MFNLSDRLGKGLTREFIVIHSSHHPLITSNILIGIELARRFQIPDFPELALDPAFG
jgi:hypothetical protein